MLPPETIEAISPTITESGRFRFEPMTLLHCACLEAMGVDFCKTLSQMQLIAAGFVLGLSSWDLRKAMRGAEWHLTLADLANEWGSGLTPAEMPALAKAVYTTAEKAFTSIVPPQGADAENPPDGQPASVGR